MVVTTCWTRWTREWLQFGLSGGFGGRLRYPIKEINDPSLQRVFGTYDDKSVSLDVFLEDGRSMPQLVGGSADVGPNGVLRQVVVVEPEFRRQQPLDRWPYAVDY